MWTIMLHRCLCVCAYVCSGAAWGLDHIASWEGHLHTEREIELESLSWVEEILSTFFQTRNMYVLT